MLQINTLKKLIHNLTLEGHYVVFEINTQNVDISNEVILQT